MLLGLCFPPVPAARQRCGHRQASLRLSQIPSHESLRHVPVTHHRKPLSGSPWPEYLAAPTVPHNGRNHLPLPAVTRHGPSSRCLSDQPPPGPELPQLDVRVTRRGPTSPPRPAGTGSHGHSPWLASLAKARHLSQRRPDSLAAARVTSRGPSH